MSSARLANAVRMLAVDAVQQANSGHPGAPMGMADMAEALWREVLKHDPADPHWPDRDRFVLSNGHGSMLLYALLHLTGYDLSIDDLKAFRQLGSRTAGHPEHGVTPGVETTTGPLGQGLGNAVGMALAEKVLAAQFNRPGHEVIDHHTYVFAGDGCLMEGISHEVCSLAGTLGLGKLIVCWDDNGISIDGEVAGWFTDDTASRFEAYGWHVIRGVDGHDRAAVLDALAVARAETRRPSFICCRTVIGQGSPGKQGREVVHGAPLGADEVQATREALGWSEPPFQIPTDIRAAWDARARGARHHAEWQTRFDAYAAAFPELAAELCRRLAGEPAADLAPAIEDYQAALMASPKTVATRKASQQTLEAYAPHAPELLGGSADLTGSNLTWWSGSKPVSADDAGGNYVYYGVREFGMAAIANGLALHGGLLPYVATFLVFSDYARNAIRMSALMRQRVVYVLTHDSIGLGEDGPTHQPVEHLASLRLIPGLAVWRPADALETAVSWQAALAASGPSCLALSRQNCPPLGQGPAQRDDIARGAYVVESGGEEPEAIILATGSEVAPSLAAAQALNAAGHAIRVVSMPNERLFAQQSQEYQDRILPPQVSRRVAVEAGIGDGWYRWVGPGGRVVAMTGFGESGPGDVLMEHFGFTADNIQEIVGGLL